MIGLESFFPRLMQNAALLVQLVTGVFPTEFIGNLEFVREGRSSGVPADGKRTVNDVNGGTVADGADANRPPLSAAEERMLNQTTVVRRTAHMEEVLGGVLFNFP